MKGLFRCVHVVMGQATHSLTPNLLPPSLHYSLLPTLPLSIHPSLNDLLTHSIALMCRTIYKDMHTKPYKVQKLITPQTLYVYTADYC